MAKFLKFAPTLAGALLGLAFAGLGVAFLLGVLPEPEPAPGSPEANFMSALNSTNYMRFIKLFEVIGGVLVAIPLTRRLGLLVLVPIVVNIIAYHAFITSPEDLANPVIIAILALTAFLVWTERGAFACMLHMKE